MTTGNEDDERSEAETRRLSDAVLRRMLGTPHRPLKKKRKKKAKKKR